MSLGPSDVVHTVFCRFIETVLGSKVDSPCVDKSTPNTHMHIHRISIHTQRYDHIIENSKEIFFSEDCYQELDLVKGFFYYVLLFFLFAYIVYYIDKFSYVDLSQHF